MLIENEDRSRAGNSGSHPGKESPVVKPPDGGWGWMVVFGSFMIHLIAGGMAYSFGIYVKLFREEFEASSSQVEFLGSLMLGVTLGSGPIAGVLTKKYGCRMVAIIGTVIAAFGFISSFFAPNIYFVYLSLGLVAGVGLGFVYLPSIVVVLFYFEKRRPLAIGLAMCGSGVGVMIFAPLTITLLYEFGWKDTVLIEAAIFLNCIPCAAVFRPLEPPRRKARPLADQAEGEAFQEKECMEPLLETKTPKEPLQKNLEIEMKDLGMSNKYSDPWQKRVEISDEESDSSNYSSLSSLHYLGASSSVSKSRFEKESISRKQNRNANPMDRKDIYTRKMQDIPGYAAGPVQYRTSVTSIPQSTEDQGNSGCVCSGVSKTMDCNLMKDMCFLLFAFSNFLTNVGSCVPYIFLPYLAVATVDGMPRESAYPLISIVAIFIAVGQLLFGFLAVCKCVNRLFLYNTSLVICGGLTLLSVVCNNFPSMAAYAAGYGLFMGVYVCLTPVVLVDLFGLDKLSMAFGIVLLVQGIGTIAGPSIAGAVYDITAQYDNPFYLAGLCILVSGAMLYGIPSIQRRRREKIKSIETTA